MFYTGQTNSSDANKDYDFAKEENAAKWNGVFINSLRKVLEQVHPSLSAREDALLYVESLCLRLLAMLCAKPSPHSIKDIKERVGKTFPNPIETWALKEAQDTVDKSKKRKTVLPVEKIHSMLCKDVLQYKIDLTMGTYIVAVLEYISADILKLAGNYVKNIRHVEISREDIEIAMCADKVLMDMFYQCDSGNSAMQASPLPPTPRDCLSYEEVVKELIHEEKQYQRDLHMIIRVFREELVKVVKDPSELEPIFANIMDIYELTVTLLGSLEDVIEMSQEQALPYIGNCFEELAEGEEFDVYTRYARDITSAHSRDALQNLLNQHDSSKLTTAGHGFREAVKFYLPKLLLGPIWHAFLYLEYVKILLQLSPNKEDKESFEQVQGLLKPMQCELNNILAVMPKESIGQVLSRTRRQLAVDKVKDLQNTVENWDKDLAGTNCNEFIRVDTLQLVSGKRVTERKLYLFDGLLVLCKANTRRQAITVGTTNFDFRMKEKFFMRRVEVIDRPDTDDMRYAFEISPRGNNQAAVLVAKTAQQKIDWMADLIMVTTKSMLDRILDSILLDIEKKHPLRLPSPEIYKFAELDCADNIVLEERESTGVPLIKGATLCKLIERLTYHIYADPMFVRTFLTTYRSFCLPHDLLALLKERFDIPDPSLVYEQAIDKDIETDKFHKNMQREDWKRYKKEYVQPVQFRVLNVLRHWVDHHFYDFENDHTLLETLLEFLETVSGKSMRKWVDSVLKIVQRKKEQEASHKQITFAFGSSPPPIEHHLQVPERDMTLLTLHPIELARQLTVLEFELYKTVKPSELVGSVWTKKHKETSSPNLLKIIKHTNMFTRWVEKSILDAENFEERVAMMSRAIEVMIVLLELNNFNGVLAVVSAIAGAAVFRLKCTLQAISARHRATLDDCRALTDDHYRRYQEKLRSINPPCVPFFGMYLTNILHIDDGNLDHLLNTELINFSKRRKVAEIIGEIQQYQNQPYCLKIDPTIRHFLENLDPYQGKSQTEISNIVWMESSRLEPKDVRPPPKFSRKWPDINLKSPGIKPRRQNTPSSNHNISSSNQGTLPHSSKSHHQLSNEGDHSPTASTHQHLNSTSSSAQEYSVFANVHLQSGQSSHGHLSQSQANLSSVSSSSVADFSDSISLLSNSFSNSMIAPLLPKRSNSIVSLANSTCEAKPILSPRSSDQQSMAPTSTTASRHQPVVSPKCLEALKEERTYKTPSSSDSSPPTISPRIDKFGLAFNHQSSHSMSEAAPNNDRSTFISHIRQSSNCGLRNSSYNLSSANSQHQSSVFSGMPHVNDHHHNHHHSTELPNTGDLAAPLNTPLPHHHHHGPIPLSPHVNVPNIHSYSHHLPPPLPPRGRLDRRDTNHAAAQVRQAPDAPQLPPRDLSPPPLPPRSWVRHSESSEATPDTPAHPPEFITTTTTDSNESSGEVELRRPSARGHHLHHHPNTCDMTMMSAAAGSSANNTSPGTSLQLINSSLIMRRRSSAMERAPRNSDQPPAPADVAAAAASGGPPLIPYVNTRNNHGGPLPPPISRRTSTSISPKFSPGETTPKLPPKPKNHFLAHNNVTGDRGTMFPYPSTSLE